MHAALLGKVYQEKIKRGKENESEKIVRDRINAQNCV
jgi:hypothetical protein